MTKEIELLTKILDWYNDENREFSIFQAEEMVKEYAKENQLQLLDFMIKNSVDCDAHSHARSEKRYFWCEKKWITREQLMQQFADRNQAD